MIKGRRTAWASVLGLVVITAAAAAASASAEGRLVAQRTRQTTALDTAVRATLALPDFSNTGPGGGRYPFHTVYQAPDRYLLTQPGLSKPSIIIGDEEYTLAPTRNDQNRWVRQSLTSMDGVWAQGVITLRSLLDSTVVRKSGNIIESVWDAPNEQDEFRFSTAIAGKFVKQVSTTILAGNGNPLSVEEIVYLDFGTSPPVEAPPASDVVAAVRCQGFWVPPNSSYCTGP